MDELNLENYSIDFILINSAAADVDVETHVGQMTLYICESYSLLIID